MHSCLFRISQRYCVFKLCTCNGLSFRTLLMVCACPLCKAVSRSLHMHVRSLISDSDRCGNPCTCTVAGVLFPGKEVWKILVQLLHQCLEHPSRSVFWYRPYRNSILFVYFCTGSLAFLWRLSLDVPKTG